ncbi:MAG: Mom family adenine methylcarbamoylation protein [Candidatus Hodarchaeales archaeon]|jgi:hypothetical protein
MKEKYNIREVLYDDLKPFILDIHYAHRMPQVMFRFGLFLCGDLVGVITYGKPASPWLCKGICGIEYKEKVHELNRLVLLNNEYNEASLLVSASMKLLPSPLIIVAYADTQQNHIGTVYQACNFLFTGTTKPRTDMASKNGKHSRHHLGDRTKRVYRSAKHRYIHFLGTKRERKKFRVCLNYPVLNYPKNNE